MDAQDAASTDVRTRQIEAVLSVLGWEPGSVDDQGNDIDRQAAELVDAVLAAGGLCGQSSGPLPIGGREALCTLPAGHAGLWHQDSNGTRWAPRIPADQVGAYAAPIGCGFGRRNATSTGGCTRKTPTNAAASASNALATSTLSDRADSRR